jgi:lipopolysaccharide export system protein LptA
MWNNRFTYKTLVIALLCGYSLTGWTLPEDSEQPINIQADRASQKGFASGEKTEYFGDVLLTQGSLKINGDHVIINSKNNKVTQIIAIGNPARFEQQSDPTKTPIKAQANRLDYKLIHDTVVLTEQASIEQNGSTVSGKRIEYNIAAERVKATGSKADDTRVKIILIPEKKSDRPQTSDEDQNQPANTQQTISPNT